MLIHKDKTRLIQKMKRKHSIERDPLANLVDKVTLNHKRIK
jgi:hypothetical protein